MPPGFYNPYDQQVYDAGFKYIPQSKYLLNPFKIPTDDSTTPPDTGGITSLNRGGDDSGFNPYNTDMSKVRQDYNAFPSRQAGEIYSKTFNPQSTTDLNLIKAQNLYKLSSNALAGGPSTMGFNNMGTSSQPINMGMSMKNMSPGQLEFLKKANADFIDDARMKYATKGQYVDQYDPNYSSMTEAQKFMDNYPEYYGVPSGVPEEGIPGAIKNYMSNSLIGKGFGMAKDFLGRVMPINERAIMENEARGAGIFTDDIGRIVTNDYNTAGGIMAGYNLNKIDADSFQKRRDTINAKMSDKINPETGKTFKQERLDLLDEAEAKILGARKKTKQIYKMRADKKAADKKKKDDTTGTDTTGTDTTGGGYTGTPGGNTGSGDFSNIDNSGKNYGPYSNNNSSSGSYSNKGGGASYSSGGSGASYSSSATTGAKDGFSYGLANGGRVYYMDGGLADMLEIYD